MKRRNFLKRLPVAAAAPMLLNGMPLRTMAGNDPLKRLAAASDNDRVLVFIQLHGGNDGLNTLIPVEQYTEYANLRPNILIPAINSNSNRKAIAVDNTLSVEQQIGFHPDMFSMKALYERGEVAIIQGVGYKNINQSHFRSRDIWNAGGGFDVATDSGWAGRYLYHEFPGYPDAYPSDAMPDPLGLEIGRAVSLMHHTGEGIPAALAINSPPGFDFLVDTVGLDNLPASIEDTYYGEELKWITGISRKGDDYAKRLAEVYDSVGASQVTYPQGYPFEAPQNLREGNNLARQLQIIARLIDGGVKTKIFLAQIGGFDTHASQVESNDPTTGLHAALLYQVSTAIKAFQEDLTQRGVADRVMTMTFSEFGRRAESNFSYGTDHGTVAPVFVVGKAVRPGVYGLTPDLRNLKNNDLTNALDDDGYEIRNDDMAPNYDYRQIYTALLEDWMLADSAAIQATQFQDFSASKLDLVGTITSTKEGFFAKRFRLDDCYPNPARNKTTISYYIDNSEQVKISLMDIHGKNSTIVFNKLQPYGEHTVELDLSVYAPGQYLYTLEAGARKETKKLMIIR